MNIFIGIFLSGILLCTATKAVKLNKDPVDDIMSDSFRDTSIKKKLTIRFEDLDEINTEQSTLQSIDNIAKNIVDYIGNLRWVGGDLQIEIEDIESEKQAKLAEKVLDVTSDKMTMNTPQGSYIDAIQAKIFADSFGGFSAHRNASQEIYEKVNELNNRKNYFLMYYFRITE